MRRSLAAWLLSQAARQAWWSAAAGAAAGPAAAAPPAAAALARQELQQLQLQQRQQQLFAWLQSAGVRTGTWHAPRHAHPHPRRRALRRVAVVTSKATALAVVGLPLAAAMALVVKGREDADVLELLRSLPRTARVVWWGLWAGYQYKALASRYGADLSSPEYQRALAELHEHAASGLLLACQANGGLYIKAGQLAVALHAVPLQYRRTLEALQDKVPPRPFADIEHVLLQDLGAPAEVLFAEFDPAATAAASLAQVHKARLHDGTQVAVKVQYPGLRASTEADLATMLILADAGHRLFPATSWRWLFEELQKQLQYELDFRNEAANAAQLAACMAGRADVAAPATFPALCTPRVLCMEWVEGCKLTDLDCLIQQGLELRQVGILLLDAFAQSTYFCGWTHGDPHPGNILVRVRSDPPPLLSRLLLGAGSRPRPQLVLLDHGIYFRLPDDLRRLYCQLWCAIVLGDMDTARVAASQLGGERAGRILPEVLRPRNWAAVPKEERRRVRQESGISSFADLASLLEEAPRPLLDSLRQSAVVRHSATLLGATLADRLRINATWALRGMWRAGDDASGASGGLQFVGSLQSRLKRWRVAFQVHLLRLAFWLASAVHQVMTVVAPSVA
ncbi:hypothetical protein ABPG75_012535 [Micractinium tetrahymenae]